ncbi:MAG TPA: hypothetical protein DIU15_02910, partial [Deltaproteobacteria bacterium]|nr:hypothetical protein [Deltaproteobacteria bacterium]
GVAGANSLESVELDWNYSSACDSSYSDWVYLTVPPDIESLALTVDGDAATTGFAYVELDGDVLFDWTGVAGPAWGTVPLQHFANVGGGWVLPNNESTAPTPGCLAVRPIALHENKVGQKGFLHVRSQRGVPSAEWDLNVVIVDGAGVTVGDLAPAVDLVDSILGSNGAGSLGDVNYEVVSTTAGAYIESEGADIDALRATTVDCASRSINAYFIADFLDGSLLGIASGIPGAMGVQGTASSGVVVSVDGHRDWTGAVMAQFLADTLAHEIGHQIGLFHTTESDGSLHDPIGDTPECPLGADTNGDGVLDPLECSAFGGNNFMFWAASGGWSQAEISPYQADVLAVSPAWE